MKKIISALTAAAAIAALSTAAGAYSINKDLGFGWSSSATISADVFADVTTDTLVTITYNVDKSLETLDGQNYWCIKPMVDDAGWPFISTLDGPTLSDAGDSYTIDMESSEISFTIPAEELEHLQNAGMAIMGHGIELLEMTFSEAEAQPAGDAQADDVQPDDVQPDDVQADKSNPDTGVGGTAAIAATALLAAGVMAFSKKK